MEPSRFPVNPSTLPSFCKAQNGVTLLAKSADVLEQAKDTCSITRQLRFSRKGLPRIHLHFPDRNICLCAVAQYLQGTELRVHVAKAATEQLIAEVAGWRAACCAIQLSACCRSIHSAAPTVPRGAPAKGKQEKNPHHTLNKFPLIPSTPDVSEKSWAGAWKCARRRARLLSTSMMGQSQGMGGAEEQDLCTGMKRSRWRSRGRWQKLSHAEALQ